jgi:hypothetical protein
LSDLPDKFRGAANKLSWKTHFFVSIRPVRGDMKRKDNVVATERSVMASGGLTRILGTLRKAAFLEAASGRTDAELLQCYVTEREEAAFEAIVRRHGPMVLGVCRRILQNPDDAEDAFQATFLVLARKAATIVPREMVSGWLYGAACLAARKARAVAARQRGRERQVRVMPEPATVADGMGQDIVQFLHFIWEPIPVGWALSTAN